ncbi:MAG TPA: type II toxin-antitoxin system VapC family toxin [Acidimicrobiales bacterium]|nr:type II toxin-antitoxin system VapC family toxin [Acidimicrobiales bacterium]
MVLDASAGVEMLLRTPVGRRLRAKLPADAQTWVPELYFVEVASVLRRAEQQGTHDATRVRVAFDRLLRAPVRRVQVRALLADAWFRRRNLTIADGVYVALADHLGATLVTTDLRLANAPGLPVVTLTP